MKAWCTEIREILDCLDRALVILAEVMSVPEARGSGFGEFGQQLYRIRAAAQAAFQRDSAEPSAKCLAGRKMSREEYYLAAAMMAPKSLADAIGIPTGDEYRAYDSRMVNQTD